MNTITAILEPDADGTLHLPLPPEWRSGPIRVKAQLEPVLEQVGEQDVPPPTGGRRPGSLSGFRMSEDFDEPLDDFKPYME